jgi:hypothetical protein
MIRILMDRLEHVLNLASVLIALVFISLGILLLVGVVSDSVAVSIATIAILISAFGLRVCARLMRDK